MKWLKSFWEGLTTPQSPQEPESREDLNNFTPRAVQVLTLARKEAERFKHHFIGTEHLLLGLIQLGQGTAVAVLGKMGVSLETVRLEVERQIGTGPDEKVVDHIPYTPRVKKVLALADKERKALNHTYLGTEHILLGLLAEGDGVAARILKSLDIDIDETRQNILKELDHNYVPRAEDIAMKIASSGSQYGEIDLAKRYDVYCREGSQEVVYRNVLFKRVRKLLPTSFHDAFSDYIELEQTNGQTIFVARHTVLKFSEHGTTPGSESVR